MLSSPAIASRLKPGGTVKRSAVEAKHSQNHPTGKISMLQNVHKARGSQVFHSSQVVTSYNELLIDAGPSGA